MCHSIKIRINPVTILPTLANLLKTMMVICALPLLYACGGGGGGGGSSAPTPTQPTPTPTTPSAAFNGSILLGSPTATSIKISLLSPDQNGAVSIVYGTTTGTYGRQSTAANLVAGAPLLVNLEGLSADTQYFYRLQFTATGSNAPAQSSEYGFHTARPTGSSFTFTVQADSHLDENSDLDIYRATLTNILADHADFHLDLGDTFMTEKYSKPLTATVGAAPDQKTVDERYVYERTNYGQMSHSVPLFLVNGNHDGELGWLSNGVDPNLANWATQARQKYFLNPAPGGFYLGDSVSEPIVGQRAAWYAWQWGDALFVVLDPYWNSSKSSGSDGWNLTLGDRQYQWLASTLANSRASYKFIFLHNIVGGLDGQMRGGVEAAPYFEWGGKNLDGSNGFAQKRPTMAAPIHQLLVQNHVTAVFHGHDHLYARQVLDGIVYQEVPQPSAKNFSSGPSLATDYHYASGTILSSSGHMRVTVTPTSVTARYVRSWLPKDETASRKNGQIDDTWSAAPFKY